MWSTRIACLNKLGYHSNALLCVKVESLSFKKQSSKLEPILSTVWTNLKYIHTIEQHWITGNSIESQGMWNTQIACWRDLKALSVTDSKLTWKLYRWAQGRAKRFIFDREYICILHGQRAGLVGLWWKPENIPGFSPSEATTKTE